MGRKFFSAYTFSIEENWLYYRKGGLSGFPNFLMRLFMKKRYLVLALICVSLIFSGCGSDKEPEDDELETVPPVEETVVEVPAPEPEPVPEVIVTPEPVPEPEPEPVIEEPVIEEPVVFTTEVIDYKADDKENCGYFVTTDELGSFSSIEGDFVKYSGYDGSYFGFIFGYSSQEDGIVPDFFRFGINVKGEFSVHNWNGEKFTDMLDLEADTAYLYKTDAIKQGYGETNHLKVAITEEGTISCYINDIEVASGIEPFDSSTGGVMVFFSVGTEEQENLPEEPVEVSYQITDSVYLQ